MTHPDPQNNHLTAEGDFVVREGGVGLVPKQATESFPLPGATKWLESLRNDPVDNPPDAK